MILYLSERNDKMNKIAKFEKVSFEQFEKDWLKNFPDTKDVKAVYDSIKLPKRATVGSAGYDFYAPSNICFERGKSTLVPTGIRSKIDEGWVLSIYPRSGLGFKHRCQLDNTVGIIDSDYYYALNEGHIMIKITNHSIQNKTLELEQGDTFIVLSNVTKEGKDKILNEIESLIEEEETL